MKTYFKLIPAAYYMLVRDGKILMLRRANTGYQDGNWSLPAGHFEGDESGRVAACREGREEIGLEMVPEKLQLVHLMHRRGTDGGTNKDNERIDLFFLLTDWDGEPRNCEPEKCDSLTWFPLTELPENTIPYIRTAIEGYLQGEMYSERGW